MIASPLETAGSARRPTPVGWFLFVLGFFAIVARCCCLPFDFLLAIEKNKSYWPSFQDGLQVSKVVDAALHSGEKGSWVNLA